MKSGNGMLWRMPEMVAPRALAFRPLVKEYMGQGERSSGNEIEITQNTGGRAWSNVLKCRDA